jgi:hypothetical protein
MLLKGSKMTAISGHHTCVWLRRYGWEVMSHLRYISISRPVFSIFLDPWRSTWLASNLQQTSAWRKLHTDIWYRHLLRRYRSNGVTDGQMLKCQWWLCGSLVCTTCYVLIEVRMKFSVSHGLLFSKTPLYRVSHSLRNPAGWRTAAPCRNN